MRGFERNGFALMLVEDDDDIREDLAAILREEGYDVSVARDGADALERLRYGRRPGVILLDLMMPRMDGWQFRHEQRKDPAFSEIPVVLLSAAHNLDEFAAELGASAIVRKPVRLNDLLAAITREVVVPSSRASRPRTDGHAALT